MSTRTDLLSLLSLLLSLLLLSLCIRQRTRREPGCHYHSLLAELYTFKKPPGLVSDDARETNEREPKASEQLIGVSEERKSALAVADDLYEETN